MNRGIKAGAGKASKSSTFLKKPIRILTMARDFYIRSFSECAGRVDFNGGLGCPAVHISTLPRSYSVSSSSTGSYASARDDDFSELVRVASARGLAKKVEAEVLRRRQSTGGGGGDGREGVTRSQSVGIGRIDEDKACEFNDDDNKVKVDVLYPRSKSHNPLSARNGLFIYTVVE